MRFAFSKAAVRMNSDTGSPVASAPSSKSLRSPLVSRSWRTSVRRSDSGRGGRAILFLQLQKWRVIVIAETVPGQGSVCGGRSDVATMTLTAQEVCFLVLFSELNTESRDLMRSLMLEVAKANRAVAAGGAP